MTKETEPMNYSLKMTAPLLAILVAGCVTTGPLAPGYEPAAKIFPEPKTDRISVLKPRDARPLGSESSAAMGFLTMVPLVFCIAEQRSPEDNVASGTDKPYDFLDDLGRIVVKDLATSGIAGHVTLVDGASTTVPKASHTLHLTVKRAEWRRYPTMYGVSLVALPLQVFGAPISFGRFELDVEAELMDAKTTSLGKAYLTAAVQIKQSLYSSDPLRIPIATACDQVSPQLRNFIAQAIDPRTGPGPAPTPAVKPDMGERLKQLKGLKDSGLITDRDFRKRKEAILKEI